MKYLNRLISKRFFGKEDYPLGNVYWNLWRDEPNTFAWIGKEQL